MGLICLFKNDKKLKIVFDKGVLALNFLNTDTINSFYGRSNNSLFGRSCTYALYSLDFIINNSINSKERADIIFNDILSLQLPDGSISLNKNTNINNNLIITYFVPKIQNRKATNNQLTIKLRNPHLSSSNLKTVYIIIATNPCRNILGVAIGKGID